MSTEEITPAAPVALSLPSTETYERAGEQVGRAYATAVTTLVKPIRTAPAPTWHWKAAHRTGTALRRAASRGADHLERRARTAPRRLIGGLRRLFKAGLGAGLKTSATRLGGAGFFTWWGGTWAIESGITIDPVLLAPPAAGLLLLTSYALGTEPDKRPMTRREKRRRHQAAADLLRAIHQLLQQEPGLHLADLADRMTARSTALGIPHKATVASLRALLEPHGVPIRDQLALGGHTKPGLAAADWNAWIARHNPRAEPAPPPHKEEPPPAREEADTAPTRDQALPHAETTTETISLDPAKPQVSDVDLEISSQDLGPEQPLPGEEQPRPYTPEQLRLLRHIHTAIGNARGAHLRDILTVAKEAGDFPDASVTELRRSIQALDIPIQDKLWLRGGNTRGILRRDVPALPDPHEEPVQETA